jgi:hypothetical protein
MLRASDVSRVSHALPAKSCAHLVESLLPPFVLDDLAKPESVAVEGIVVDSNPERIEVADEESTVESVSLPSSLLALGLLERLHRAARVPGPTSILGVRCGGSHIH